MRRLWSVLGLSWLALACDGKAVREVPTSPDHADEPASADGEDGVSPDDRYILHVKGDAGVAAIERHGGRVLFELREDLVAASIPRTALEQVKSDPDVEGVDVDPRRYLDGEQVPYGIEMVQAETLGAEAIQDKITVCVIDSGYHSAHEDLPSDVTASPDTGSGAWNVDSCGHGTHVAGTIAALDNDLGVVGVAPGAVRLHIVKVFGENCDWTYSSILARAVYECVDAGAKIINMSLGGGTPYWFEELTFEWASLRGVLSIAAAGNGGSTAKSYPASYADVVSVAAVDADAKVASFSQRNDRVELAAPGVGVLSTTPSGYAAWNGTSMATPHVAGVAALVWSRNPSATNQEIRDTLHKSAFDIWPAGRDDATGFGLVRAREALTELDGPSGGAGSGSGSGNGSSPPVDCQALCGCAP